MCLLKKWACTMAQSDVFCSQIGTTPELVAHSAVSRRLLLWRLTGRGLECQCGPQGLHKDSSHFSGTFPHCRHFADKLHIRLDCKHASNHLATTFSNNGPTVLGVFTQGKKHPAEARNHLVKQPHEKAIASILHGRSLRFCKGARSTN